MAFLLAAQLLPVATTGSSGWVTFESAGMEYMFDDQKVKFSVATQRCADEGAMLASPNTDDANDFIYNLPGTDGKMFASRFIGLQNVAGTCDEDKMQFQWDTMVGYVENSTRWSTDEPNNIKCKEFCVAVGDWRGDDNGGKWSTVKCDQKWSQHGYVCQRPLTVAVHELQSIVLGLDNCEDPAPRKMEPCVGRKINEEPSCDLESVSVTRNSDKTGIRASATVIEETPDSTALEMNGATPMQLSCIHALGAALVACAAEQGANCPSPTASFAQYSSCTDGVKNGQESGVDCGGNDCTDECSSSQPSRGGQSALSGGDPHYVASLSHGINLCYDVHGSPGDVLNLVSSRTLLVNTLVVAADKSVSGTYHGAIGMVSLSLDGSGKRDTLAVLADGTVTLNGDSILRQTLGNRTISQQATTMKVEIVASKSVTVTLESGPTFQVTFVESKTDHAHLDLAIVDGRGINGTEGIIGQFVQAKASVSPKDNKVSILTVNGNTVETVRRSMPQIAGADDECYKYIDTQAAGILKGTFEDYRTAGIFQAPVHFNLFPSAMSFTGGVDVDSYVNQTAHAQKERIAVTAASMRDALAELTKARVADSLAAEPLRNALISAVSTRLGFDVEELQALTNEELVRRT